MTPQIQPQLVPPTHRKEIVAIFGIFLLITVFVIAIVLFKTLKPEVISTPSERAISKIEVSTDNKSVINSETKEIIFNAEDVMNYIKSLGSLSDEINPDNQATYGGGCTEDCLVAAALSNNKDRIVFSAVLFPKDLESVPWIGVYNLPIKCSATPKATCHKTPAFQFLIASNGINFIWSQGDKTITYDGGMDVIIDPEKRKIDANSGKILEIIPTKDGAPSKRVYKNEKYGFELTFPDNWISYDVAEADDNNINYINFMLRLKGDIDFPSYETLFQIGIFPEKDWEEKNADSDSMDFTYVAKNNEYYFGYSTTINFSDGNDFVGVVGESKLISDVKQIISTFKFIGQDETGKVVQPTITSTPKQNNEKRNIQIQAVLNNIYFYTKDKGQLPPEITQTDQFISSNGANICLYIISDAYGLPMDPKLGDGSKITKCPATYNTGYLIKRDAQGHVTVSAPYAEMSEKIVVSR